LIFYHLYANFNLVPISSIQSQKMNTSNKSNLITYIAAIIGLVIIVFFSINIVKNISKSQERGAVNVVTQNPAEVYVNGEYAGTTPYESREVKVGENKISIKTSTRTYETSVNFLPSVQVVLNRDLGTSELFSAGQNLWMEKNDGQPIVSVISDPADASVFIDNTELGKTPFTSDKLSEGEYELKVSNPGYEDQVLRIKTQKGLTLNISAKLFPMPVPSRVEAFEGSENLFNLSSENALLTADTEGWVRSIVYWNETRGVNLAGLGINKEKVFDYFLDYKGNLFTGVGDKIVNSEGLEQLKEAKKGGYLGRKSDGEGLTAEAKEAYKTLTGTAVAGGKTATIKETGLGWLRVRDDSSLNGKEVTRVNVGETFPILEEKGDWAKIEVSETVQGWVSKAYIEVKESTSTT